MFEIEGINTIERQIPNSPQRSTNVLINSTSDPDFDPDDPSLSIPLPRYNAMLAVLRNTLYMFVSSNFKDLKLHML